MSYRRSLTTSSNLLSRRFKPSFGYVVHEDDCKPRSPSEGLNQHVTKKSLLNTWFGFGAFGRDRSYHPFFPRSRMGIEFHRPMSTSTEGSSDNIELITDVAGVIPDATLVTLVQENPVVSEVTLAAADSFPTVAALQMLVDEVHSFTGCNWWASIAITTLLIRVALTPLLINQLKATAKLTLLGPQLDEIRQEMKNVAETDREALTKFKGKIALLFKEYGVTPFTPFTALLIQFPVLASFFFGVLNMAEKVPSFKYGGEFWFIDLSTPDSLMILPCLTALSFLIVIECILKETLRGNPIAGLMMTFYRVVAFVTIPFTVAIPKAVFCYLITSNMFSLVYGLVIRRPEVKKFLGVPIIPPVPPSTTPEISFSPASLYKQYRDAVEKHAASLIEPYEEDRPKDSAADSPANSAADSPPTDDSQRLSEKRISQSSLLDSKSREGSKDKQILKKKSCLKDEIN